MVGGASLMPLLLEDSSGNVWSITADANGNILATNTSLGTQPPFHMNDLGNYTSWLITAVGRVGERRHTP
jgi:hypothetical protein